MDIHDIIAMNLNMITVSGFVSNIKQLGYNKVTSHLLQEAAFYIDIKREFYLIIFQV